jgi:hypothetical protein
MIYCNSNQLNLYAGGLMASKPISTSRLDRVAMALSGLCAVHCVATAILLGLLASAGGLLGKPIIHEVGLILAMCIGAIALGRGVREHGFILPSAVGAAGLLIMGFAMTLHEGGYEAAMTIAGVSILALGHRLNMKAKHRNF